MTMILCGTRELAFFEPSLSLGRNVRGFAMNKS